MERKFKYAVVGAGRQGVSSAFDLALRGNAELIYLIDSDLKALREASQFVKKKTGFQNLIAVQAFATEKKKLYPLFKESDVVISAVPYYFNLDLSRLAIQNHASFCDMGGNTKIVREQLKLHNEAKEKGVAIVPDTGMGPGLNISMIRYAFDKFDEPEEITAYVGGLPLEPKPPWNYELIFNINGLTNEYYGNAFAVKNGKVVEVPALSEVEKISFANFGELEAAITSGGLSTAPWTFEGKLKTLQYKTLRYPGHWQIFKAYSLLGLFSEEPVEVKGQKIVPRDFYHALLEPKLKTGNPRDVGLMKIVASGKINGSTKKLTLQLIEEYDENLGLTAMQKLTGWHTSIVAHLLARKEIPAGAHSIENIDGKLILEEAKKRGFDIKEKWE